MPNFIKKIILSLVKEMLSKEKNFLKEETKCNSEGGAWNMRN